MTLERFALRISGPIDFVINLAINTAIPWLILKHTPDVPLLGLLSLFIFVGPMVFCVLLIATFSGHWNGVMQRNKGVSPGPLPPGSRWAGRALKTSLGRAIVGLISLFVLFLALNWALPNLRIPSWGAILIDGVGSAILGYLSQVSGVLRTRRLG